MINFENFKAQIHNEFFTNLVSRKTNKAMLDQETYNTKISNQIDISAARIERPLQIRQDLINEGETYEDLEEVTGKSDPFKSDKQDPVSTSSK